MRLKTVTALIASSPASWSLAPSFSMLCKFAFSAFGQTRTPSHLRRVFALGS